MYPAITNDRIPPHDLRQSAQRTFASRGFRQHYLVWSRGNLPSVHAVPLDAPAPLNGNAPMEPSVLLYTA